MGSMCFCSCLLRAVVSVLSSFWESFRQNTIDASAQLHLDATVKVIACMSKVHENHFVVISHAPHISIQCTCVCF